MKRKKKAGVNPRLAQSLYRALADYWVRIAGCDLWKGGRSVLGLFSLTVLLCLCVVVSL